jgi:hypothetical protein
MLIALSTTSLAACGVPTNRPDITPTVTLRQQIAEILSTPIISTPSPQVLPTSTATQETSPSETRVGPTNLTSNNPCANLGQKYAHNQELGEIKEEYVGSWHAAPMVGDGYNERLVFFTTGNYIYFPSQYECANLGTSCTPSPIEQGTWGIQGDQLILAKDGDIDSMRSVSLAEIRASDPNQSPYPLQTIINGKTYWLLSTETNLWNPITGEMCK